MEDQRLHELCWLPELTERVRSHLKTYDEGEPSRQQALAAELRQLDARINGWMQSLANPDLPVELRLAIEAEWKEALARKRAIEQCVREYASQQARAEQVLVPEEVLARLDRLADVLAANNPTLGNLELSFHIDRIDCFPDGRVVMRTCQLGALGGAAELVAEASDALTDGSMPQDAVHCADGTGPRRRTRLRLHDADSERSELQARADFVADPHRFGELDEQWFWRDEFQVPVKTCWAVDNAAAVANRYQELLRQNGKKPSLSVLAAEFQKSRPTITAALEVARNGGPVRDRRRKDPGSPTVDAKALAEEFARLEREEGLQRAAIAKRHGVHRNTVARVLNEWYQQQGLTPGDCRKTRWRRAAE
ncbi:MAG: hypothetical protein JNL18_22975 [Planctomycetaceae bacterium]|nr:hypothetical protein [Planctomycetaceae bacterium]